MQPRLQQRNGQIKMQEQRRTSRSHRRHQHWARSSRHHIMRYHVAWPVLQFERGTRKSAEVAPGLGAIDVSPLGMVGMQRAMLVRMSSVRRMGMEIPFDEYCIQASSCLTRVWLFMMAGWPPLYQVLR
mmetsp:Transcript_43465/g.78081  ORF Transcript_43465/g.78081 Transcript_43465/m.78081 type:complete len:128 (+) Transcript_43465:175-558(+)